VMFDSCFPSASETACSIRYWAWEWLLHHDCDGVECWTCMCLLIVTIMWL